MSERLHGALDALERPLIILCGHFGSGKSELAVNLAFGLRARGRKVLLGDLDLVKPYFRCRLVREDLEAEGIRLIAPEGEQLFADLPILLPTIVGAAQRAGGSGPDSPPPVEEGLSTILDVGGDDTGARVLGSLAGRVDPARTDLLFVVNTNRPFAESEQAILAMLREVEAASRMKVTGLVANTHLMDETSLEDVRTGLEVTRALSASLGVPVRFCAVGAAVLAAGSDELASLDAPLLVIERHILPPHVRRRPGSRRSLAV